VPDLRLIPKSGQVAAIATGITAALVLAGVLLFVWALPAPNSLGPKTRSFGTVSGVASPCLGLAMPYKNFPPVKVDVLRGNAVVGRLTASRPKYEFTIRLSPGEYVLKGAAQSSGSVKVIGGETKILNLNPGCE